MKNYILVIDEGTTGVRTLLFDRDLVLVDFVYEKLQIFYPGPDEVESDAAEIYEKTVKLTKEIVAKNNLTATDIASIAITTQRTSWVVWDTETGEPLRNAILWLDARGRHHIQRYIDDEQFNAFAPGVAEMLPGVYTPLIISKLLAEDPEFAESYRKETTLWGNMDSWLVWKLTGGAVHATSYSTASASTMLENALATWNSPFIDYFGVRPETLPEIKEEADSYGMMSADILGEEIPIYASVADQQAALFSQNCHEENTVKCTMGTGTFVDVNVGSEIKVVPTLTNMICWQLDGKRKYLLEGMASTAGASLEWAKNTFRIVDNFEDMDKMSAMVEDSGDLYFVPALAGMIAPPYHDESARGAFMGINGATSKEHFVKAVQEGVAFAAVLLMEEAMHQGADIKFVKVAGGVTKSKCILQTIADATGAKVIRPLSVEATALGAAELAAIKLGWIKPEDVCLYEEFEEEIEPSANADKLKQTYENWKKVVERTLNWEF